MKSGKILLLLPPWVFLWASISPVGIPDGLGMHDFEFFLKARLIDFLFLEFLLEGSNVVEGHHAITLNILLAGLPQVVVILFPK